MISYPLYQHNINSFTECLLNNYSKLDTFIRPILITLAVSRPDDFVAGGVCDLPTYYIKKERQKL